LSATLHGTIITRLIQFSGGRVLIAVQDIPSNTT